MKCTNPNHKCAGDIGGTFNECNQCGWRVPISKQATKPEAIKLDTKVEPKAEN